MRQLRLIGLLEGISLLVLLGVATPLKHFYGNPTLVRVWALYTGYSSCCSSSKR
ncbi:DUF3817 domain-containing protein [Hymenobacter monticola]|uniref:hypothetical protein n=1 Tax=Hymenobacter monticola TaxID=1705399 RepID=UPI00293F3044|nr:hypothetical protein [Hymenobacter monticola]